jgi:hypothetical protein
MAVWGRLVAALAASRRSGVALDSRVEESMLLSSLSLQHIK